MSTEYYLIIPVETTKKYIKEILHETDKTDELSQQVIAKLHQAQLDAIHKFETSKCEHNIKTAKKDFSPYCETCLENSIHKEHESTMYFLELMEKLINQEKQKYEKKIQSIENKLW